MNSRTVLHYDVTLGQDNSWRLLGSNDGISVRLKIGGINYSGAVLLRWRKPAVDRRPTSSRTFVAPVDTDLTLWITQPCVAMEGLLPVEFQLERAPQSAIDVMVGW